MRKIILGLALSLDGYIEGPNGEYDWCFTDQDYGMNDFFKRIDSIFMGRKSYEVFAKAAEVAPEQHDPFKKFKKYVFSNTLNVANEGMELVSGDTRSRVNEIKKEKGKDIWLFGGAGLTTSFINERLLDELWLSVHPILLGKGKPLFSGIQERVKLNLVGSKTYSTGLVSLVYRLE